MAVAARGTAAARRLEAVVAGEETRVMVGASPTMRSMVGARIAGCSVAEAAAASAPAAAGLLRSARAGSRRGSHRA